MDRRHFSFMSRQSKIDMTAFLAKRPDAPVSSFMEIYESGQVSTR